jgi:hypothetical protein
MWFNWYGGVEVPYIQGKGAEGSFHFPSERREVYLTYDTSAWCCYGEWRLNAILSKILNCSRRYYRARGIESEERGRPISNVSTIAGNFISCVCILVMLPRNKFRCGIKLYPKTLFFGLPITQPILFPRYELHNIAWFAKFRLSNESTKSHYVAYILYSFRAVILSYINDTRMLCTWLI